MIRGSFLSSFKPKPGLPAVGLCVLCILLAAGLPPPAAAQPPFSPGERLTFSLRWMVVPAGKAVLEVMPFETAGSGTAYHFSLTATSNAVVDRLYKVRDRIDAWADPSLNYSLRYRKSQQEGRHRREVEVTFDRTAGTARYANFGREEEPVPLIPGTLDPLSAFYRVRGQNLTVDTDIRQAITDGKTCVVGVVRVIRKETIRVLGKTFDTLLLEPDLKHVGGVFEKSPDASIRIWVTDDEKKIPVKLVSKVVVGSFVGELESVEQPAEKPGETTGKNGG